MKWLIKRLKEKGTQSVLAGAIIFAMGYFGLDLDADQKLTLAGVVSAVTGFFVSFFAEKTVED